MPRIADLVVLGGGPAGAVAAWLAAKDGLDVVLVDPCMAPERVEGMSPRLHAWLAGRSLLAGFDGLVGPLSRISHWGESVRSENSEWLVSRAALDAHLRAAAVSAGAVLHRTSGRVAGRGRGMVRIALADGREFTAHRLFDARGRKAHAGRRAARRGPSTLSICGWVETDGQDGDGPLSVSILPIRDGWLWLARVTPNRAWAQFLGDADAPGAPIARLEAALRDVAGRVPRTGRIAAGSLVVRDSAPVLMPPARDLSVLPIGDAAAAGDPLSGHGQFWAVSSALAATAVRRSLAARPGAATEAPAQRFLAERMQEVFLRQSRVGRDFIRMMEPFREAPFWARRRDFPDNAPLHTPSAGFETGRAVVVRDGLLEEADILKTPASPSGVAWFGAIPAVEAWRAVSAGMPVERMVARWGDAARQLPQIIARERSAAQH